MPAPDGLARVKEVVDLIEHVYQTRVETGGRRMIARIQATCLRFDDL